LSFLQEIRATALRADFYPMYCRWLDLHTLSFVKCRRRLQDFLRIFGGAHARSSKPERGLQPASTLARSAVTEYQSVSHVEAAY
jgi:hypothetical protein